VPEVIIAERFCGPPHSGNGGYTCGLIAGFIEGAAQVTLRKPPPLDRPLTMEVNPDATVCLLDQDGLIAEGVAAAVDREVPARLTLDEARLGAEQYEWAQPSDHPYPNCFVCGPSRRERDGMRIFPGPVPGRDLYGAPWRPDDSLVDLQGRCALSLSGQRSIARVGWSPTRSILQDGSCLAGSLSICSAQSRETGSMRWHRGLSIRVDAKCRLAPRCSPRRATSTQSHGRSASRSRHDPRGRGLGLGCASYPGTA